MEARNAVRCTMIGVILFACTAAMGQTVNLAGETYLPLRLSRTSQYDATVRYKPLERAERAFSALFAYTAEGYYRVTVAADQVRLERVDVKTPGKAVMLARGTRPKGASPVRELTFRRMADKLVVLVNGRVLCSALDATYAGGHVLVQVGPGQPEAASASAIPREPILFSDDFMVTGEEAQSDRGWREVKGSWKCVTVRDEKRAASRAYIQRSANAFVYLGHAESEGSYALSVRGEPWWSRYSLRASVQCQPGGAGGLVFGYVAADTFWWLQLVPSGRLEGPSRLQLMHMEKGEKKVVSEVSVCARSGRWFALGVEVLTGRVRARFQGHVVMDVSDARIVGGPVGLYADGKADSEFDDVEVRSLDHLLFDRAEAFEQYGEQRVGRWRVVKGRDGAPDIIEPRSRDGLLLFGNPTWEGGAATAEVRLERDALAGLVAGADGSPMVLLVVNGQGRGQVIERAGPEPNAREAVLAEFEHDGRAGEWLKIGLNLSDKNAVQAYVGDGLAARVGRRILGAAPQPEKAWVGRIGLFHRGQGVAFRGLIAHRSRALSAPLQIGNAIFLGDAYMSSWATEQGQWIPDDGPDLARSMRGYSFDKHNEFWRKGDYFGDYVMVLPLTIEQQPPTPPGGARPAPVHTPITGSLALHFGLQSGDLDSGYTVRVTAAKDGSLDLTFSHRGKGLRKVSNLEGQNELLIYHSRHYIWARLGSRELFLHRKAGPNAGTRIAATRSGAVDFARLAVHAENLNDTSFERAATDWKFQGQWSVTNRFSCDPRWSWMGVDSLREYSALWHRDEFIGDQTVELYGSMKMRLQKPYYVPSDLNLTLCADEEAPGRGYTFIVGGWGNTRTAILRNGKIVAETDRAYLPDTRDSYPAMELLHRRWFYVKARRQGTKVQLFLDNELYLEYTDPDPLPGGRVGVWTTKQSLMVARVMVYYDQGRRTSPLTEAPPREAGRTSKAQPLSVNVAGRQAWFFDFESGIQGWGGDPPQNEATRSEDGWGNATAVRDAEVVSPTGGQASLKLINTERPGQFTTLFPVPPVDLLRYPLLGFDYRIPEGGRLNLYFDVVRSGSQGPRTCFVQLTGPGESRPNVRRVGRFEGTKADGQWRSARINIAQALRRVYPTARTLVAKNLRLALESDDPYVAAGLNGGYPIGASYHLDNVMLVSAGVGDVALSWKPYTAPHEGYAVLFGDTAMGDPGRKVNLNIPAIRYQAKGSGLRFLHMRPMVPAGSPPAATTHWPFLDLGTKVQVQNIQPAHQAAWGGEPVRIRFSHGPLAALRPETLRAVVAGRTLTFDGSELAVDWEREEVVVAPKISVKDGQVVDGTLTFSVHGGADPLEFKWEHTASVTADKTPPSRVEVQGVLPVDDFEDGCDAWQGGPYTVRDIDRTTAASGEASLHVVHHSYGGNFLLQRSVAVTPPQRLGGLSIIEFDYRAGPDVRVDLVLGPGPIAFGMFDRTPQRRVAGIPNVQADGQWHRATVDVFKALWPVHRRHLAARLTQLGFADLAWASSRLGDSFHIDNLRLVPLKSTRQGLPLKLSAHDRLGIAGYAFVWSDQATAEPPKTVMTEDGIVRAEDLPDGRRTFHVRAVDRAGNWGPIARYDFVIDNTPPKLTQVTPKPGSRMVPGLFSFGVEDRHGVDPATLRLKVGEAVHTLSSPTLRGISPGKITWDQNLVPEDIVPIPDGKKVAFELSGIKDFAGNVAEPVRGTWVMDYRRDRQPPQRVEVDFAQESLKVALLKRFDRNLEGAAMNRWTSVAHRLDRDAFSHVAELFFRRPNQQAMILPVKGVDLAKAGVLAVDVKLPKEPTYIDVYLLGKNFSVTLRMGDAPPNAPEVGSVDRNKTVYLGPMNQIRSRDGWHMQWADLGKLLRAQYPNMEEFKLSQIHLRRSSPPYNRNRRVMIDNLMVCGYGKPELKATLRSRDISGLVGYAVEISPDYAGDPPKAVNHQGDTLTRTLKPGVWFVKLWACDNNKNWSRLPGIVPYIVK